MLEKANYPKNKKPNWNYNKFSHKETTQKQ
jgi:hypothetical protein